MLKVKESSRASSSRSSTKGPIIISSRSLRSKDESASVSTFSINSKSRPSLINHSKQSQIQRGKGGNTINAVEYIPIDLSVACNSSKINMRSPPPMIPLSSSSSRHLPSKSVSLLPQIWHICELCDGNFPSKFSLIDHHRKIHRIQRQQRREKPPELEIIPITLDDADDSKSPSLKRSLADEIIYHPPSTTRIRRISTSSSSSGNQNRFLNRQNSNEGSVFLRPFELLSEICRVCSESFSDKRSLMSHMKTVHPMESRFGCSICDRVLSSRAALIGHMRTHTGEKPHTCPECNRAFSNSQTLTRHLRIHTGEKPYECPICGKRASLRHNMKLHIKIHEKQMMFVE